ncbi:MAG: uroporphyrinogen decarboxylase family protein [Fimbriimonadales bacterium]
MTSKQRVSAAVAHQEPDRVPVDFGATPVSGMHVSVVYGLRQALKMDPPGTPVKVIEPYQLLGEIGLDLVDALGIDAVAMPAYKTMFGFTNSGWKEWALPDGTPVLVPAGFNTEFEADGSLLLYPEGDKSVPASGLMPKGGNFFDAIIRQPPIDDDNLNVEDNLQEFGPISEAELAHYKREIERLAKTDKAVIANFGGTGFGDIALVPVVGEKHPRGIRDVEEWYISTAIRTDYIREVFERQCEIGLANLKRIYDVVGDGVYAALITGTDFGTQRGPFISRESYTSLFAPFHRKVTDWVHENTGWKCMIHSCGSVVALLPDFIEAGFEIFNPVQCSAEGMDPRGLKERFGDRITFWGGGINTQHTLPFGTADEVRREVRDRIGAFGPGGGFVFNAIHNVQARTPVENMLAMFDAVREFGTYPAHALH